jgi:large subunit ribosomal protein L31
MVCIEKMNTVSPKKKYKKMKKGIHPESYRMVAFKDMSNGHTFLTRSTVQTRENLEIDGVTYPLVKLEISNTSHPFYTGKVKLVDTAGRVDKFMTRYKSHMDQRKK